MSVEQCAQNIISVSEEQCAQNIISVPEERHAQHIVQFVDAHDQSDSGSLTTQAPQSSLIRATINALSTWISAVQPRESWYLAGWINDTPIDFLVDPGAVVSAISLQYYEKLVDAGAIHTPLKKLHMELEASNKSDMTVHGTCSLELTVHGLVHMDTVVVDLNCQAILGMDILGDATKLPFILDLVDGTLSGGGYETVDKNQNIVRLPAAGIHVQHQDVFFIPPPRAGGGAQGASTPVSTATLGLIHRHDPSLAALLHEDPASLAVHSTRRRVYSTMRLIRTGMLGQLASLQQREEAMHVQDEQ